MNWLYYINNKTKIATVLTIIIVLVLVKNILDKRNVAKLGNTFNEVYTDRLMVEGYILKLSGLFNHKTIDMLKVQNAEDLSELSNKLNLQNNEIRRLIEKYEKTKLTKKEAELIVSLKSQSEKHFLKENNLIQHIASVDDYQHKLPALEGSNNTILMNLAKLSEIQIEEGKKLNENSKNIVSNSLMLTYLELIVIVVTALIIQAMIFATKSVFSDKDDAYLWN